MKIAKLRLQCLNYRFFFGKLDLLETDDSGNALADVHSSSQNNIRIGRSLGRQRGCGSGCIGFCRHDRFLNKF